MEPLFLNEEYRPIPEEPKSYSTYEAEAVGHYQSIRRKYEVKTYEQLMAELTPKPESLHAKIPVPVVKKPAVTPGYSRTYTWRSTKASPQE